MQSKHISAADMARIALSAALLAVSAAVTLPLPFGVPMTLQTFAAVLIGCLLAPVESAAAVGIYLALGAVGMPVFSGMQGGFSVLVGKTGGFLLGFLPLVVCCSIARSRKKQSLRTFLCIVGLLCCHFCGVLWFFVLTKSTLIQAFLLCSLPYLLKDLLSLFLAAALAKRIAARLTAA